MRSFLSLFCVACVFVAVSHAAPATLDTAESSAIEPQNDKEVIEIINLGNFGQSDRDKRDINMLRQLFPGLAQIVDNIIQEVTRQLFRVVGRAVLSGGLGGGGNTDTEGTPSRGKVSVSLPTFPPDEDDEDDDNDDDDDENSSNTSSTTTSTTLKTASEDEDNSLSGAESQNAEVRVKFDDQDTAASGGNGPSPAEESADESDADRNKRFLPFGVGHTSGDAHAGGSAGGSGNFLFDIIRQTADRAARTAGTVYRYVAGTENLGLGLTATSTATKTVASNNPLAQLVAGSGATEHGDAALNGAIEADVGKGADGYTEGIPGPITRLFVIANRGIANLIQDLILRLAQTSERIVNFKARLVTALI